MSEAIHSSVDVSTVLDGDVRRVLRQMQQEYLQALARQQAEIDALLEVVLEKHVTSVGELRRQIMKLQQQQQQQGGATKTGSSRLREALWGAGAVSNGGNASGSHGSAAAH